jgi:hypothetical protein
MTTLLTFSFDRALQLDAFLRSMEIHSADKPARHVVLYKASSEQHERQYAQLAQYVYPHVEFVRESEFHADMLRVLREADEHVGFFVDDDVFVRRFSFANAAAALDEIVNAVNVSFIHSTTTTHCYTLNREQVAPSMIGVELYPGLSLYDWRGADGDYGYPLQVAGALYRKRDLLWIHEFPFSNPNTLEAHWQSYLGWYEQARPHALCFTESVMFLNQLNRVQGVFANRHGGKAEYSSAALASLFDAGYRANVLRLAGTKVTGCLQETDLVLENVL